MANSHIISWWKNKPNNKVWTEIPRDICPGGFLVISPTMPPSSLTTALLNLTTPPWSLTMPPLDFTMAMLSSTLPPLDFTTPMLSLTVALLDLISHLYPKEKGQRCVLSLFDDDRSLLFYDKRSMPSFKALIFASASACFCCSFSNTSLGAPATKRSLLSFFITELRKPSW